MGHLGVLYPYNSVVNILNKSIVIFFAWHREQVEVAREVGYDLNTQYGKEVRSKVALSNVCYWIERERDPSIIYELQDHPVYGL